MLIKDKEVDIIRLICMKMALYIKTNKLRFLRRLYYRRQIDNLFDELLSKGINDSSAIVARFLLSLTKNAQSIIENESEFVEVISDKFIVYKLLPEQVTYGIDTKRFEVDTNPADDTAGLKYDINGGDIDRNNLDMYPSSIVESWFYISNKLEEKYVDLIANIAITMNNIDEYNRTRYVNIH